MRKFASTEPAPPAAVPETSHPAKAALPERPKRAAGTETGLAGLVFAITIAAFWIGCASAYLFGYIGPRGLGVLDIQEMALFATAILAPPVLFVVIAWALARGQAMGNVVALLSDKIELLVTADDVTSRTAAKLGRTVRHELDALNAGIDGAFQRLRALENVLQSQIAALDEAGARADVRGEAVAARLGQERERLESIGGMLGEAASRAGETVSAHASGLKALIDFSARRACDIGHRNPGRAGRPHRRAES